MGRKTSQRSCLNCRRRHLRCDEEFPTCGRCRRSNVECDHRIRHEFRFVNFQETGSGRLEASSRSLASGTESDDFANNNGFVDETGPTQAAYRRRDDTTAAGNKDDEVLEPPQMDGRSIASTDGRVSEESPPTFSNLRNLSPTAATAFNNPPSIIGLPLAASIQHIVAGQEIVSIHEEDIGSEAPTSPHPPSTGSRHDCGSTTSEHVYQLWERRGQAANQLQLPAPELSDSGAEILPVPRPSPINHAREAYLIKFFMQTWGPIFDCLDSESTFTNTVTRMALTSSQSLFWAVLATSALQLSRVSNYPFAAAQYYRSQCSKSIMPILLNEPTLNGSEETLFATYVMLRNYEHMTCTSTVAK